MKCGSREPEGGARTSGNQRRSGREPEGAGVVVVVVMGRVSNTRERHRSPAVDEEPDDPNGDHRRPIDDGVTTD